VEGPGFIPSTGIKKKEEIMDLKKHLCFFFFSFFFLWYWSLNSEPTP
jgi:hypothetical protein